MKITIETKGKISKEESQEAFQVADEVFALLMKVGYENNVEIIKVTCWREHEIGPVQLAGHYGLDFQLVFSSLPKSKQDQVKAVARWNKARYKDRILVYKDEVVPSRLLPPGEPREISLQDEEIKTLAVALIEAMRMVIQDRWEYLSGRIAPLGIANKKLECLTKVSTKT